MHRGQSNPAIEATYFPDTVPRSHGASDANESDPLYAWIVDFGNGNGSTDDDCKSVNCFVRLVRSGQ